ncbi:hypothetical protein ACFSO7_09140 [Bacillus sp. CGMCC 1.16607]|uniref:hypothetical protein n=1 Tax=Bacillus sp. CGMCC 1.16607 TaxID=3351842 RepID=UPI0036435716
MNLKQSLLNIIDDLIINNYIKKNDIYNQGTGLRNELLLPLYKSLESALDESFRLNLKDRVIKVHKFNSVKFDFALEELKRFFLLAALVKNGISMYSMKVDAVWHEMLMFTKEYDSFCENFIGRKIHHVPRVKNKPLYMTEKQFNEQQSSDDAQDKRLLFNIIYSHVFITTEFSHYFWGEIETDLPGNWSAILDKHFRHYPDLRESVILAEQLSLLSRETSEIKQQVVFK